MKKTLFARFLNFIKEFDFFWSIPLAFLLFITYPIVGAKIYGDGFSSYSPEFFHAGLYAGLIILLFNSFTQLLIYFNFPTLYHYYLEKDFDKLLVWQKSLLFLVIFSFFFFALLTVFLALV